MSELLGRLSLLPHRPSLLAQLLTLNRISPVIEQISAAADEANVTRPNLAAPSDNLPPDREI